MCEENLARLRREIDLIDAELVRLIGRRAAAAVEIGREKQCDGLPILDLAREAAVMETLAGPDRGPLPYSAIRGIFTEIISACRAVQKPPRVAYLGPEATFTHLAAEKQFGRAGELVSCDSIAEVFKSVHERQADFGVVPVENSTEGSVGATLDELARTDLRICGEILLDISHCILSRETDLNAISRVLSHPQALAQCSGWLRRHLPAATLIQTPSTAAAALQAADEEHTAAVGNEMLAELYCLAILARGIQDQSMNQTRFAVVGRGHTEATGRDKTSVLFVTPHRPGALYHVLAAFAETGINLTRIESRPSRGTPWEYVFFVDFEGHLSQPSVASAIERVEECVQKMKILGSYPAAIIGADSPPIRNPACKDTEPLFQQRVSHLIPCQHR